MTTDAHPTEILIPRVMWAQRKKCVYLSIEVFNVCEEKIELDNNHLTFSGVRKADGAHFALNLEFFAPINVATSKKSVTDRDISFILEKEDQNSKFWPRLVSTSSKLHYIHIDFNKWIDEDEENEASKPSMGNYPDFDYGNYGGMDEDDEGQDYPPFNADEHNPEEQVFSSSDDDENIDEVAKIEE